MKPFYSALILLICVGLVSACSSKKEQPEPANTNETGRTPTYVDTLAFLSAPGDTAATIQIAIADTPKERSAGLMRVTDLPSNKGMLFIFKKEKPLSFWMANTPLSLDIIFVNAEKQIVRIHHSTQPFTQQNYASGKPAQYVVETIGGFSVSHDIQEGMKIAW